MIRGAVTLLAVLALCGCSGIIARQPATTMAPATVRASQWPAPDNRLTPGGLTPGCKTPRPQSQRSIGAADHAALDTAYHYIGRHGLQHLEYDHRIPFALCGSNGADNVWPEIADGISQSKYIHNEKDLLEDLIINDWHDHTLTLQQAQNIFRGDWRHAWCQWVHAPNVICDV